MLFRVFILHFYIHCYFYLPQIALYAWPYAINQYFFSIIYCIPYKFYSKIIFETDYILYTMNTVMHESIACCNGNFFDELIGMHHHY